MQPESDRDPKLVVPEFTQSSWNDVGFGVGEYPSTLSRFNWGAYLLTPIWSAVYGAWPLISLWMLGLMSSLMLSLVVPADASKATLATVSVVTTIISAAIKIWIGMNAAPVLWKREQMRLAAVPDARPRFTVGQFVAKQRTWSLVAIGYLLMSMFGLLSLATGTDPQLAPLLKQMNLTTQMVWVTFGWTAAETLLVVWLANSLKREASTGGASKGE